MTIAAPSSLEFRAVTKRYGAVTAVDDVSFTIAPGTLVTLLGPSGCGKTTTLRLIAGLEIASQGRILIGDEDVTTLSASERDVSMVFQSYALFPHMSVLDNVAYGPTVQGAPKRQARELAQEKLALVGLSGLEKRSPSELSGGQQQRVAVARALVLEPKVLLFDEPLSNLDAKLRRRVREDIRELQQKLNLTVAYVTHDQEEALAVSDRIIVMSNATIAQIGTPRELYEEPASLFVADFIGDANLIDAEVIEERGERALVRLGPLEVELARRGARKGPVKVAVRPDAVTIGAAPDGAGPANGAAVAATVVKGSYSGPPHRVHARDAARGALRRRPPHPRPAARRHRGDDRLLRGHGGAAVAVAATAVACLPSARRGLSQRRAAPAPGSGGMITWRARATGRCRPASSRSPRTTPTISSARWPPWSASRATVPADAFTAADARHRARRQRRADPRDGLVLTIGYLITEAETVWLITGDGRAVQGHVLGYDQATGFGLVQALGRLDLPALALGDSKARRLGERVVVAGAGGRPRSVAARIVAKQEFAGYWEYVLDEAIFTAPAHPHWGGTALIGPAGDLHRHRLAAAPAVAARQAGPASSTWSCRSTSSSRSSTDLLTLGRPNRPPGPGSGCSPPRPTTRSMVVGLAEAARPSAPACEVGDVVLAVRGPRLRNLAGFFRRVWALGHAGVEVPLTIERDGRSADIAVASGDRNALPEGAAPALRSGGCKAFRRRRGAWRGRSDGRR